MSGLRTWLILQSVYIVDVLAVYCNDAAPWSCWLDDTSATGLWKNSTNILHFCHTNTHTHTHNRFTALWILLGTTRVSRYQKQTFTHSLTPIVIINHPLSASSIYYDPWHPLFNLRAWQSFSNFSLIHLLAWHPPLHTPYISSPNHCLLFTAHACTITTCFAIVLRLCHLILISQPFTWNSNLVA